MKSIDGRWLYYMFLAGYRKVHAHRKQLNRINVFPVQDGDTGANMTLTLAAVVDTVRPERPYKQVLDQIAETALLNARGNSGVIFGQFPFGISAETAEISRISIEQFAVSAKKAVRYVYEAIEKPVEGTILTIVRAWSEFLYTNRRRCDDFGQLLVDSNATLRRSLAETPTQLEVLARANVVDAGACAFVFFIEGMIECIRQKTIRHLVKSAADTWLPDELDDAVPAEGHLPQQVRFHYCTEALIRNCSLAPNRLTEILKESGDSVVVAGAASAARVHVHTNHPGLHCSACQQSAGGGLVCPADDGIHSALPAGHSQHLTGRRRQCRCGRRCRGVYV